jgi:LDH2 family malate/lactate/ureidoglycolate dehydrogenase
MALMTSSQGIPADRLAAFVEALLQANGLGAGDATTVAEVLIWADLRGVSTHGVAWLGRYMELLDEGQIDPRAQPTIAQDDPARLVVEGNRCSGAVAMMRAIGVAVDRARRSGTCVVGVRNTTHTGAIGRYATWAAERGCAAIILVAGPPLMAAHGARVASLSTSPIAIAVPRGRGALLLDMATSVVPFSRLRQARINKETIPAGWAITEQGEPTTDGTRAAIPLPLGGAKGSGLALMSELLASVLLGNPIAAEYLDPAGDHRHRQNALMIVIDVGRFLPAEQFEAQLVRLAETLTGLPRAQGCDAIRLPGERGDATAAERAVGGIPVPPAVRTMLAGLAGKHALAVPWSG